MLDHTSGSGLDVAGTYVNLSPDHVSTIRRFFAQYCVMGETPP